MSRLPAIRLGSAPQRRTTPVMSIKTLIAVLPTASAAVVLMAGCASHGITDGAIHRHRHGVQPCGACPLGTGQPITERCAQPGSADPVGTRPMLRPRPRRHHRATPSADTQRRVVVSFTNTSSESCTLTGFPGADLVTAAGGVLVNVERRQALAAHRVTLGPGEAATADVVAYAIDTSTGADCPRIATLVVTPPNDFQSHMLEANLPICSATVSSVD